MPLRLTILVSRAGSLQASVPSADRTVCGYRMALVVMLAKGCRGRAEGGKGMKSAREHISLASFGPLSPESSPLLPQIPAAGLPRPPNSRAAGLLPPIRTRPSPSWTTSFHS